MSETNNPALPSAQAGPGVAPPVVQALRKLPRYWMHIPNAAASSTQVVCWVDVQRVLEDDDVQADVDAFQVWRAQGKGVAPPSQAWQPMETYRDDGEVVVVWNGQPWLGYYQDPDGWFADVDGELLRIDPPPTLWIATPPVAVLDRAVALPEEK